MIDHLHLMRQVKYFKESERFKMAKDIKLSPKHGVNPTIPLCAWCGEPKNEIALLGHIGDRRKGEDLEAPRNCVLDYAPCEHCQEQWSAGVAILEATTVRPTPYRPPIQKDGDTEIYPTMRLVVIKTEAAERIFNGQFRAGDRLLLEDEAFERLFGGAIND